MVIQNANLERAASLLSAAFNHSGASRKAAYAYQAAQAYEEIMSQCHGNAIIYAMAQAANGYAVSQRKKLTEEPLPLYVKHLFVPTAVYAAELTSRADEINLQVQEKTSQLHTYAALYAGRTLESLSSDVARSILQLNSDLDSLIEEAIGLNSDLVELMSVEEGKSTAQQNLRFYEAVKTARRQ